MITQIINTLEMIKFSHSIFALPFALGSLMWATQGRPQPKLLLLVILAMVFARSAAMAFNRLVDAKIDAKNPRTDSRHIPQGLLTPNFVIFFTITNSVLFIFTAYFINTLGFLLSPLALGIVFFYSYTKRFTNLTQIALGVALGISPIAAWIAATGTISILSLALGLAVLFWVAGFDLIYAAQDLDFDKKNQVGSLVVALGLSKGLTLARAFHLLAFILLIICGFVSLSGSIYFISILFVGALLIYEHSLVKPTDLSRVNAAFFNVNGLIGILFFVGICLDIYF